MAAAPAIRSVRLIAFAAAALALPALAAPVAAETPPHEWGHYLGLDQPPQAAIRPPALDDRNYSDLVPGGRAKLPPSRKLTDVTLKRGVVGERPSHPDFVWMPTANPSAPRTSGNIRKYGSVPPFRDTQDYTPRSANTVLDNLRAPPAAWRAAPQPGAPPTQVYGYDGAKNAYTLNIPSRPKPSTRNR